MSEVVAVIPARGGSKGVPGKNLRRVGGIPLVARAILAAQRSGAVDRTVVSTDDAGIAAVAREWGAEVVERPAELSGDLASSESAVLHALDDLASRGVAAGAVAFLQATSPFIDPRALADGIGRVRDGRFDSVFAATATYGFLWGRDAASAAVAINHEAAERARRQDREPHFLETGAFYVFDAAGFRAAGHRFFGRIGIVEVAEGTALEIDTPFELAAAQALAAVVHDGDAPRAIEVDAVVTDFDGVHTDDTAWVSADGVERVRVSRADGMGVSLLRRAGLPVLILSTETDPVVSARAEKLRVEVRQGIDDKADVLQRWAAERGIPLSRIAYLGNDVNDLGCLEIVGWPVAVADAHPLVLASARTVLERAGGDGAVRELAERVLAAHPQPAAAEASVSPGPTDDRVDKEAP